MFCLLVSESHLKLTQIFSTVDQPSIFFITLGFIEHYFYFVQTVFLKTDIKFWILLMFVDVV